MPVTFQRETAHTCGGDVGSGCGARFRLSSYPGLPSNDLDQGILSWRRNWRTVARRERSNAPEGAPPNEQRPRSGPGSLFVGVLLPRRAIRKRGPGSIAKPNRQRYFPDLVPRLRIAEFLQRHCRPDPAARRHLVPAYCVSLMGRHTSHWRSWSSFPRRHCHWHDRELRWVVLWRLPPNRIQPCKPTPPRRTHASPSRDILPLPSRNEFSTVTRDAFHHRAIFMNMSIDGDCIGVDKRS